jgi:hypothetical protein
VPPAMYDRDVLWPFSDSFERGILGSSWEAP